jgi:hypothetical protein
MPIFGKRSQAYEVTGLKPPGIGGQVLNQVGMNLLGVDIEGMRVQRAMAEKAREFDAWLAQRVAGRPASVTQAQIGNMADEDISAAFAPQMDVDPGMEPLTINSPEMALIAAQANRVGSRAFDPIVGVLKAQAPEYDYVNGQRVIKRGAGADRNPAFIAELDKGMRPTADGGVEMLPNYDRVVGQIAGATTSAQEGARAGFDLVDVPDGSGGTIKMPRIIAAQILAGKAGGLMGDGAPPNIGRTLPQAQIAADQARAVGAVEKDLERPAKIAALDEQDSALREMKALLPDVVAGFGSDVQLQTQRALAAFGNEDAKRKVAATETFINQGRVLVSQIIRSFGANPTEGERKYAEKMAGADAELNPATLAEGIRLAEERSARERARLQGSTPPPSRTALEAEMRRRGLMR